MNILIAIFRILGIPVNVLVMAVKYFIVGTSHRKLQGRLIKNLKMALFKAALALPVKNTALIAIPNSLVLKIISLTQKSIVSSLPNFGGKYDRNSYWIVRQPKRDKSDPIIIYLHGGGYFLQTQPSQIESVVAMYKLVDEKKRNKLSILLLDYKLVSNGHKLPTQHNQLHETYLKLINDNNDNIILMGDSAGGHLAINYLHYLNFTSPELKYPSNLILISPWINLNLTADDFMPGKSYHENSNYDMLSFSIFEKLSLDDFISPSVLTDPKFAYSDAKNKNKWDAVPFFKDPKAGIFVIVGEDESFRDDILEWSEVALDAPVFTGKRYGDSSNQLLSKLRYSRDDGINCKLQLYIEPWGVHDSLFFFENHILKKVKSKEYKSVEHIDGFEFYGLSRVIDFINKNV